MPPALLPSGRIVPFGLEKPAVARLVLAPAVAQDVRAAVAAAEGALRAGRLALPEPAHG
jgi:hypothetical protein